LETEAKVAASPPDAPVISLETRNGKRLIGTARVSLQAANTNQ
jgi:hypothetical protein